MLKKKFKLQQVSFINIGGILNYTTISEKDSLEASDIGPGMCLLDTWVRKKTNKRFDINGNIAKSGTVDQLILNQALDNFYYNEEFKDENINTNETIKSYDIKDFDISFIKGLSLEDGASTLVEFTAKIIQSILEKNPNLNQSKKLFLCGGGRKNDFLVERIKYYCQSINLIDELGIDGDFIESQAFAYLAIRSFLKLPISFPGTTGCSKPISGGIIIKNF